MPGTGPSGERHQRHDDRALRFVPTIARRVRHAHSACAASRGRVHVKGGNGVCRARGERHGSHCERRIARQDGLWCIERRLQPAHAAGEALPCPRALPDRDAEGTRGGVAALLGPARVLGVHLQQPHQIGLAHSQQVPARPAVYNGARRVRALYCRMTTRGVARRAPTRQSDGSRGETCAGSVAAPRSVAVATYCGFFAQRACPPSSELPQPPAVSAVHSPPHPSVTTPLGGVKLAHCMSNDRA